ncbi:hypothetical protein PCK1_000329 [Pneumocystis canis]|nr:hypothetical protein PCK1_000329 [Pneumocystis canis]
MANSNTVYYLNSIDQEFDQDLLTSLSCGLQSGENPFNNRLSLECCVMPFKYMNEIQIGIPEVSCQHSSISTHTPAKRFLDASRDTSLETSLCILPEDNISNGTPSSLIQSDLRASALREKLISGVWWKEFGIVENDIVERVCMTVNGKPLCHGVVTSSGGQRHIYVMGDLCFKPYFKEKLLAIIDFSSNFIFCNKLFIRIKKSNLRLDMLVKSLVWIGFQVISSTFLSQNYILLFIFL